MKVVGVGKSSEPFARCTKKTNPKFYPVDHPFNRTHIMTSACDSFEDMTKEEECAQPNAS